MTRLIAQPAFPKGNTWHKMRDEPGTLFTDEPFADPFALQGQPAETRWRLALVVGRVRQPDLTGKQGEGNNNGRNGLRTPWQ